MNYDTALMNRALMRAGQEELTEEDIEENTTKYRTIKAFYLPTYLLMIKGSDWTSLKQRAKLELSEEKNLTEYIYRYILPVDCARAIEVDDNEPYIVEGNNLYTDVPNATLLYITNGKREELKELPDEYIGNIVYYAGLKWTWKNEEEVDGEINPAGYYLEGEQEDFPTYKELYLSDEMLQCFEYHLAAEIVLKITGDVNVFNMLLQLAIAIEDKSRKESRSQGMSRQKQHAWWSDRLGLTNGEDEAYDHY